MTADLIMQAAEVLTFLDRSWMPAFEQAQAVSARIPTPGEFILFGSGDSHAAAIGLSFILSRATGIPGRAMPGMEAARYYLPDNPGAGSDMTAIAFSVSGEVARTIEAIEIAAARGMKTLAVTASPESSLARAASAILSLDLPAFDLGPGLPGYIGALLLGTALASAYAEQPLGKMTVEAMQVLPEVLSTWIPGQMSAGAKFAGHAAHRGTVFIGSGPAYGPARYGAAKLVEIAGEDAWAQDVEEWCHLEYFCAEPAMPTMLLSSGGRSASREREMQAAAAAIGRDLLVSRWDGAAEWPPLLREMLSPFALWAAPTAYALRRGEVLDQRPFRGFSGGRSQEEGGGASRVRSSDRLGLQDLQWLP